MGKGDDYKWKVSCVKEEEDDKRRRDRLNGKDVIKGGYQIDTGVFIISPMFGVPLYTVIPQSAL